MLETTLNSNFKVIPDIAQLVFFARNINHFKLEHLQASGSSATVEEVRKFISRCKDESISLTDLQTYLNRNYSSENIDFEQENTLRDVCKMFAGKLQKIIPRYVDGILDDKTRRNLIYSMSEKLCPNICGWLR